MKFSQDYEAALSRGEYPPEWIDSAISYKKLKKCIKRVRRELLSLGLDKDTLEALWQHVGSGETEVGGKLADRLLQYSVDDNQKISFMPRLTIVIDPRDGSPMDAWLSPDTRRVLRGLAQSSKANGDDAQFQCDQSNEESTADRRNSDVESVLSKSTSNESEEKQQMETVEIPLTSDSEFFQILRRELADLDQLQHAERIRLEKEITTLGNELRILKASKAKQSKEVVEAWREILELYSDSEIFLSSHEADAGARDATHAQKQLQSFNRSLEARRNDVLRLGKEANSALDRFLRINVKLLRLIKFQEINKIALTKIMKKFDKKTALHAQSSISSQLVESPYLAQDLAKATCFTISEEILKTIPQLNDYLCPVCFGITWRPVRLRCNHVFCIRCLIVLQRQEQDHCPLCREEVVLDANEDNIDKQLVKFLKENFKAEVKAKQKSNEYQAGVDRWGVHYEYATKGCIVM